MVVLTDGDGTYPAESAPLLVGPLLVDAADMAVGVRRPVPGAGAMSLIRGVGQPADPGGLSDLDRARAPPICFPAIARSIAGFARPFKLRSSGFEIETELASEAVARRLRVVEVAIPYHPRIAGTQSKLRAFRDGRRILVMILFQSLRLRPVSTGSGVAGAVCIARGLCSPRISRPWLGLA